MLLEFDWSMELFSPPEPGFPAAKSSSVPQKNFCVLVGVTGSVAALKLPLLVAELLKIPGVSKSIGRSLVKLVLSCFSFGGEIQRLLLKSSFWL